MGTASNQRRRRRAAVLFLDWLEQQPGQTWQERWNASEIADDPRSDWRLTVASWARDAGRTGTIGHDGLVAAVTSGLGQLLYADVLRPPMSWLVTSPIRFPLGREIPRLRDPHGFATLAEQATTTGLSFDQRRHAIEQVSVILAAKGGTLADITVGDCLELIELRDRRKAEGAGHPGWGFYQLLHALGHFPPDAPTTLRMLDRRFGHQLSVEELVDQYALACRPVRDLLVAYLAEHRPRLDYASLKQLAYHLAKLFWKDLENHHPGIDSLRLPPDIATAWKSRTAVKTVIARTADGHQVETSEARADAATLLTTVRALYLDLSHWASEEPERWAAWAVPCPVRRTDIGATKDAARRKSRMDQRTRERLPHLPALRRHVDNARVHAAALLKTADRTPPGETFSHGATSLRRTRIATGSSRIWAEDPVTSTRRDLTREDGTAFWTWAAVEVLHATGIRIEELTELSHHSLVQYRLPSTGELVPLLHIAPSKNDLERLLVISPELADVLAAIIHRVRDAAGAVPLVVPYDVHEHEFTPAMPVLFQHRHGADARPISAGTIRRWITDAANGMGLTDASGALLDFKPHDFRRIFATEAIMNGMPPHICQLIMGHANINTTMGYKAVYPEEAITGHRAYLARRRDLRPSTEYRSPTDEEWEEFLGHFEHRKVSLGTCGRAYGTGCIHEHPCIRCPLLRTEPAQLPRLLEIRDNLLARIDEAREHGWLGEVDGLNVSLSAANNKIAQLEESVRRTTDLGMPRFHDVAPHTITPSTGPHPDPDA
ncbi:tyrosine-type recombinase/integrase [Streptomyces fulvoviolaceus]|uniref:tyrosine-type recombinase/integrase n=1 Tax=Streptomyces fulvoviolaceus TaxID=285535 RepID=UPI0006932F4C|nr:tyrosine-type recombinase/integrase [Streptomyces fulvoviolaceus]